MQPRTVCATLALLTGALVVLIAVPAPRHVALLERLAPRIERAQTLTPEARAIILQLMDRARDSSGDARDQARRDDALQRVTDALNGRPESVGRAMPIGAQ